MYSENALAPAAALSERLSSLRKVPEEIFANVQTGRFGRSKRVWTGCSCAGEGRASQAFAGGNALRLTQRQPSCRALL